MHQEYLNAFADKASSDTHILAAWLEGSLAKRTADRYSDIDVHLLVAEENKKAFQQKAVGYSIHTGKRIAIL